MKAASFNANSLRSRVGIILDWLDQNQPDILCVQETKVQDEDFPHEAFEQSGYNYVFRGEKKYNGVAIFSRDRIVNVEYGLLNEPRDEARLIKASIGGINVVNTYIPQGYDVQSDKFEYKLQWFKRLKTYFAKKFKPCDYVLWMGDFNVAPEPRDVYDPDKLSGSVCFHPAEHKALGEVMRWGFVDIFRLHCEEEGQFTFWDYRIINGCERNLGWRLDHIMATQVLSQKSISSYIDRRPRLAIKPSDHTFIVAEFDL
ncbi:MAG: exodeoxyribonuclease III [Planctomycetota bacterium]